MFQSFKDKWYLCIDPGSAGGWVHFNGSSITSGGNEELAELKFSLRTIVVIEKVPAFVGPIPASSSFKLGYSYGWLVGLYQGQGLPTVLVTPQTWQKTMGVGTKNGDTTTVWKNKLKAEAQRRWPNQKITLKTADAFCLLSHAIQHNL
jgi:hypothetical protein